MWGQRIQQHRTGQLYPSQSRTWCSPLSLSEALAAATRCWLHSDCPRRWGCQQLPLQLLAPESGSALRGERDSKGAGRLAKEIFEPPSEKILCVGITGEEQVILLYHISISSRDQLQSRAYPGDSQMSPPSTQWPSCHFCPWHNFHLASYSSLPALPTDTWLLPVHSPSHRVPCCHHHQIPMAKLYSLLSAFLTAYLLYSHLSFILPCRGIGLALRWLLIFLQNTPLCGILSELNSDFCLSF